MVPFVMFLGVFGLFIISAIFALKRQKTLDRIKAAIDDAEDEIRTCQYANAEDRVRRIESTGYQQIRKIMQASGND